nr:YkgJ family cysteine cluster protein [uncultured Sphingomonas sp.]
MNEAPSAESALCTSCGLCCTGALHDQATLEPRELEEAATIGLPVRTTPEPSFALPCPKLDGSICTIYGQRPRVCAAYACRLLEEVRGGRDLATTLPVVNEARRLADELRAHLSGETFPDARAGLVSGTIPAAARLRQFALSTYLDRHFRNRNEGTILKQETCS